MIKNKRIILFLIIILVCNLVFASAVEDSLIHKIDISNGIEKIDATLKLSFHYRRINTPKAKELAESALKQIIAQNFDSEIKAEAIYCLGLSYFYDGDYQNALDHFYRSVTLSLDNNNNMMLSNLYYYIGASIYFSLGDNAQTISYYNQSIHYGNLSNNYRILGAVYSSLSNLFRVSGSYEKSLEFIYKSKNNYTKANYREGIAWIDYTTGSLYSSVGLYEEAQKFFTRSLTIYRDLSMKDSVSTGVAICLDQLAVVNMEMGNEELARKYNKEAQSYYRNDGSLYGLSNSLKYQADIEIKAGNYAKAKTLLDSSLSIKKASNDIIGYASIYSIYGELFIDQHKYQRALDSLEIGLNYAIEKNQMGTLIEINRYIAKAYKNLGEFDKAYTYKSNEVGIADSIYSAKATRNMLQLETLYEIESKEQTIKELEKEKLHSELSLTRQKTFQQYLLLLIFLSLFIIVMFIYFYRAKVLSNKELQKNKKIIEESNISKDKFFSILAHDLINPFNSILGLTNILKERHREMDEDKRDEIIQAIYKSSSNNYELLNTLLEWSRSQRGKIKFTLEQFIINDLAKNVKDIYTSNSESKGIEILIDPEPVTVKADKNMIYTVLRNLIFNAIKYTNHGDKIQVKFSQKNSETHVSVKDTGIGINVIDKQKLFEIENNFQIEGTAGEKGSGLGLILCKEFIDKHQGKIWVESEPGKGSTFHFTIPNVD
jgi:signal transduction histidine kinase